MDQLRQFLLVLFGMILGSAITLTALRLSGTSAAGLTFDVTDGQEAETEERVHLLTALPSPTRDWVSVFGATPSPDVVRDRDVLPVVEAVPLVSPNLSAGGLGESRYPTATPTPVPPTPVPPTQTPAPVPAGGVYVVQAGDSLASIAERYGVSTEATLEANDLKRHQFIWMGQELRIPTPQSASVRAGEVRAAPTVVSPPIAAGLHAASMRGEAAPSTPQPSRAVESALHVVERGDTLTAIARRYGTSVEAIVAANDIRDRNLIRVGERLVIPTAGGDGGVPDAGRPSQGEAIVIVLSPEPAPAARKRTLPGKMVFQTGPGGDIYVVRADGGGPVHVATGMDPCLSADGEWVAFARWGEREGIYAVRLDGSEEKLVYSVHQPRHLAWSPDGTRIAFSYQNGSRDTETRDKDGKLHRYTEYFWRMAVVGVDGRGFTELPSESNQNFSPTWSPDGKYVAFSDSDGLVVSSPDGFYRELTHGAWHESPSWSPDGSRIAYMVKQHDHYDIFIRRLEDRLDDEQRFLTDNKGIKQMALTSPPLFSERPVNNVCPVWSPDGRYIAFLSDRDGHWAVYVMEPDGSAQRRVFDPREWGLEITYDFARDRTLSWGR